MSRLPSCTIQDAPVDARSALTTAEKTNPAGHGWWRRRSTSIRRSSCASRKLRRAWCRPKHLMHHLARFERLIKQPWLPRRSNCTRSWV